MMLYDYKDPDATKFEAFGGVLYGALRLKSHRDVNGYHGITFSYAVDKKPQALFDALTAAGFKSGFMCELPPIDGIATAELWPEKDILVLTPSTEAEVKASNKALIKVWHDGGFAAPALHTLTLADLL